MGLFQIIQCIVIMRTEDRKSEVFSYAFWRELFSETLRYWIEINQLKKRCTNLIEAKYAAGC